MSDVIYHGSTSLFDRFSLDYAGRGDNASNGALGVWVTPVKRIATAFGGARSGYLYEITVQSGSIMKLPLQWLVDRNDEAFDIKLKNDLDAAISYYERIRCDLISKGYTQIWIIESDGSAKTRVVLDPNTINILAVNEMFELAAA